MIRHLRSLALTFACAGLLLAPAATVAQPGAWQTEEQFLQNAGSGWEEIAPGVYELERADGTFTRVGFGVESFEWALEQAQSRLERLSRKTTRVELQPELERRMRKTSELVGYLERSIETARAQGVGLSSKASESGSVCAGYYDLDVSFTCSSYGQTTSTAGWSEFGPFAPYYKTLHTYAEASWYDKEFGITRTNTDEDTFGPFQGECCVEISSNAYALNPNSADLYGSAYVSVTNGCSAYRFIQDSGDCY